MLTVGIDGRVSPMFRQAVLDLALPDADPSGAVASMPDQVNTHDFPEGIQVQSVK
jgi:hypothetical protein